MAQDRRELPPSHVVAQLHMLGVARGDILLVHTSFRAAGPIEGGPAGLIHALESSVVPQGTVVMPSWIGDDDTPFDPARTPTHPDLGTVAEAFWRQSSVQRASHPFAFAAKGARADEIIADPLALPPHQHASAVGRVFEFDGRILLLGVHHDANTTLHLAELMAGAPYRRPKHITVSRNNRLTRLDYLENDHCCQRFRLVDAWLKARDAQSEGLVGHAPSKLMRSRDLIDIAVSRLKRDPLTFLHSRESDCRECAEAWAGLPA